ncbi:HEAT repeat-containing protein [Besnoitia besnoiti]|uniref:HEAT repeat-containing protein n=1 Tax=Besnoitia besnoiti TaxID=94643 RepID=A0A2A9M301_BESBE|nr:HEAT repeat-containing protein [Besnoitia besnoiti]PFH31594.1 HEAT repeat-containing protein [Besnoitia besnoiti]
MSALPVFARFALSSQALSGLQSADNAVRSASEAAINGAALPQLLPVLAQSVREAPTAAEQQLAAILLRRCLQSRWSEIEASLPAAEGDALLQEALTRLLQAVLQSPDGLVKKSAADAAAEVWRKKQMRTLEDAPCTVVGRWLAEPELGPPQTAAALFRLLDRLCEDKDIGASLTQMHAANLRKKIACALQQKGSQSDKDVEGSMAAALDALATCVSSLPPNSPLRASFCELAPLLLSALFENPSAALFIPSQQLAETLPQFFAGQHPRLLQLVVQVAVGAPNAENRCDDKQGAADVKTVALQLAVSAVISAPKWAKKNLNVVRPLLEVLAECCGLVAGDEEAWGAKEREEEDDDEEDLSQEALLLATRVAERLNSDAVLEMLLQICTAFFASDDWQRHLAALSLLAALLEEEHSSAGVMRHADEVISVCLLRLSSPHARLRWAALNCLCFLLQEDEREGDVVTEREKNLLEKMLEALQRETNNRCRRKGLQAVAEFFSNFAGEGEDEDCKAMNDKVYEQLSPYIDAALQNAVVPLCDSSDAQTQELALAVGSVLAQVSGQHFQRFYSFFMGAVRRLLSVDFAAFLQTHAHGASLLETVVEFAGALAAAVGMEVFAPDAAWLLERLIELQRVCADGTAGASLQATALEAVGETTRVMGAAALPFLPAISPIILAKVQQHAECNFAEAISAGEEAGAKISEEGRISTVNITDKCGRQTVISINTAAVEEKCAALRLLGSLAGRSGGQLPPMFACEWAKAIRPECSAQFAMVRQEAYEALPSVVNCLVTTNFAEFVRLSREALLFVVEEIKENNSRHVSGFVLPAATRLLENLMKEKERRDAQRTLGDAAADSGAYAADAIFNAEQRREFLAKIFEAMGRAIIPILTQEYEALAAAEGEDDEWENVDEDEEEQTEAAADAYDAVMQTAGALCKLYGAECLPFFDAHLKMPFGALLAHEKANPGGKVAALCIFADAINFGGEAAGKAYGEVYLPAALLAVCPPSDALTNEDLYSVSAAAYGIGACAVNSRELFLPRLAGAREALTRALQSPVLQTEEGRSAADCAACALLKVVLLYTRELEQQGPSPSAATTIFTQLLSRWFPLKDDAQEIDASTDLFVKMLTENHVLLQAAPARNEYMRVVQALLAEKTKEAETSKDEDKKLLASWKKLCIQKALERLN